MSRESPVISVILPAFNSAAYLAQAIESILAQTFSDFELLVIYDKSSDHTLQIIEGFIAQDKRVHIVQGQKARLVGALNLGIDLAKGGFVARMDADDISLPTRFEQQMATMQAQDLDFCGCNMVMISAHGDHLREVVMPSSPDLVTITLACTVPFAHGSVMMRKAFLDQHALLYQQGASAEDYDFWCKAYHLGAKFGNVDQYLFYYRHFPQSLSKVHAKVVHRNTKALRRDFVKANMTAVSLAIERLLPIQHQLSVRDENFLILTAYLLFLQSKSGLIWSVLKQAHLKSSAIALVKIIRGF